MELDDDPEFRADQTDTEPDVYDSHENRFIREMEHTPKTRQEIHQETGPRHDG